MCKLKDVKFTCWYDCPNYSSKPYDNKEDYQCVPCNAAKKRAADTGVSINFATPTPRNTYLYCNKGSTGY
jgi:hypothetical protein